MITGPFGDEFGTDRPLASGTIGAVDGWVVELGGGSELSDGPSARGSEVDSLVLQPKVMLKRTRLEMNHEDFCINILPNDGTRLRIIRRRLFKSRDVLRAEAV